MHELGRIIRLFIQHLWNRLYVIFLIIIINIFLESFIHNIHNGIMIFMDVIFGILIVWIYETMPKWMIVSVISCIVTYFISFYKSISIFYICIVIVDVIKRWLNGSIQYNSLRLYNKFYGIHYFNYIIKNRQDQLSLIFELFIFSGLISMGIYGIINNYAGTMVHSYLEIFSYNRSLISSFYIIMFTGMQINLLTMLFTWLIKKLFTILQHVNGINVLNKIFNYLNSNFSE